MGAVVPGPEEDRRAAALAVGPLEVPVLLHGQDTSAWPIWTYATEHRLDTRVGLHDMLTHPDGTPTDGNTDLIDHALRTRPW